METAIANYEKQELNVLNPNGQMQPIFVDIIIKLNICRAFANKKI